MMECKAIVLYWYACIRTNSPPYWYLYDYRSTLVNFKNHEGTCESSIARLEKIFRVTSLGDVTIGLGSPLFN